MRRRLVKIALVALGLLLGLPVLGLVVLLIGANTDPGRRLIERAVANLSHGMVTLDGLSGQFPDALRVDRVAVSDAQGAWLTIEQVQLDWSPSRLLRGEAKIDTLAATRVSVDRIPVSDGAASSPGSATSLPVGVAVDKIEIERLDLAAPVVGVAAGLHIQGDLNLQSAEEGYLTLDSERLDSPGTYKVSGAISPDTLTAKLTLEEPAHGLISAAAGLSALGPLSVAASLDGPRQAEAVRFTISAGPLHSDGQGKIDLTVKTLDLDVGATAPAMSPRPDLSWQSVKLDAHLHGSFTRPDVKGRLDIAALHAGGGSVDQIAADIHIACPYPPGQSRSSQRWPSCRAGQTRPIPTLMSSPANPVPAFRKCRC